MSDPPMSAPSRSTPPVAEPVSVDIRRSSMVSVLSGALLLTGLSAAAVYAAVDTGATAVRVVGTVFAILFGAPVLLIMAAIPRLATPRGLVVDARGITYREKGDSVLLPWQHVAAVGIGYEKPPETPKMPPTSIEGAIKDFATDRIEQAIKLDRRRSFALEIFPVDARMPGQVPLMARYRRTQQPPAPGLPRVRWRIPLPPVLGAIRQVRAGVRAFQPSRWLGEFERPWTQGLRWPPR